MSQPTIELVWQTSGPELNAARGAVRVALTRQQLLPVWAEWKADDSLKPRRLKGDAIGPRLYVNRRLAWTSARGWRDGDELEQAIATFAAVPRGSRERDPLVRRFKYVIVPSAVLALVPKCPLCWIAYASITAAFGLAPLTARWLVLVALTVMLIAGAGAVIWRSIQLHARGPLWAVSGGALLVLVGATQSWTAIAYAGLCTLLAAAIWSAWPRSVAEAQ